MIVTLQAGASAADLEQAGYTVIDNAADMAIVSLPMDMVETLAADSNVKYIDFGHQAAPLMDMAREASFVTPIHEGTEGLSRSYKGEGVYVGLYDTGLDPGHINFTDHDGNTRVKSIYLVKSGSVSRYENAEDIASFTTDTQSESHGTHVLGIMAGARMSPAHMESVKATAPLSRTAQSPITESPLRLQSSLAAALSTPTQSRRVSQR